MKKKKIALLLVGAMLVMSLSACGDKKEETSTDSSETESTVSGNDVSENDLKDSQMHVEDEWDAFLTDEEISMDDLVASVDLCDYDNITVDAVYNQISEDDVTKEMNEYLSFFDAYEHVMEGTIEDGKTANITFVGKIDGEEFDGGSGTFDLDIGSNSFIDGFEDGLIGKKVGDEVTLNLKFPSDYFEEQYRDKDVVFDVTINYLLGEKIPAELTDEYLSNNTDYESVDALHDAAKEYLENTAYNTYLVDRENGVLDYLIQNSKIPLIPRSMVNEYVANMETYYQSMAEMYSMEMDEFLSSYMGTTAEDFKTETKKSAVNYMQSAVILQAIAAKENITVSDEEYEAYLSDFATENGYSSSADLKMALESNNEVDQMREEVLYNKVMRMIYEKNNMIVEPPVQTEIETNAGEMTEKNTEESASESEDVVTNHQMKQ